MGNTPLPGFGRGCGRLPRLPRRRSAGAAQRRSRKNAHVLGQRGRLLGSGQFRATAAGYGALLDWLTAWGPVLLVGVEGTGVYGAGLAEYLQRHGVDLVEVDQPDR